MSAGSVEVSDEDKRRHREVEKSLKEVRDQFHSLSCIYANILSQCRVLTTLCIIRRSRSWPHRSRYVEMIPKFNILAKPRRKVLLLGSGDSGKSTILKVNHCA
jgi:hypothetical protein